MYDISFYHSSVKFQIKNVHLGKIRPTIALGTSQRGHKPSKDVRLFQRLAFKDLAAGNIPNTFH